MKEERHKREMALQLEQAKIEAERRRQEREHELAVLELLRADVSKYRPEAYKSEKLKNPKKIHRVALVKLLSEIYIYFFIR